MKIEASNNLLYDNSDSRCLLITSIANGQLYAFIQAIDLGGGTKRYWGPYNHDTPEEHIEQILLEGGKWPELPA